MKVKMNGYNLQASQECLSEIQLAIGFAMEYCGKNNLPNLEETFYKMHADLHEALVECGYYGKKLV